MSLSQRTKSAFPLSIGTSLALESLYPGRDKPYDEKREIPTVDKTGYRQIYINLHTLFRNLVSSQKEDLKKLSVTEVVDTLLSEMEIIDSIFSNEGQSQITPVFYNLNYEEIQRLYRKLPAGFSMRVPETPHQKAYHSLLMQVVDKHEKSFKDHVIYYDAAFLSVKTKEEQKPAAMMLSHHPWDLLSSYNFSTLGLLESHTGVLKKSHLWYTKYNAIGEMPPMPFDRKLLLVFGDKEICKPTVLGLRKLIKELAVTKQWTGSTTIEKVTFDLNNELKDRYLFEVFMLL